MAPAAGEECIIIDPGIGVLDDLDAALREHRLKPAAVLLTHGHLDHTFSVTPVCGAQGIPALIHASDNYRLADPITTLGPELRAMLEQSFGRQYTWQEPDNVIQFDSSATLDYAGMSFDVLHAPGHTEGSAMFTIDRVPEQFTFPGGQKVQTAPGLGRTAITGDVLFRGSIGRTDLPGGSMQDMLASLKNVVLPLSDDHLVLPGHGPASTIGRERTTNPYLLEVAKA